MLVLRVCRLLAVSLALGAFLAGPEATTVHAYGACEPYRYCPPWRDCGRTDCDTRRGCGDGRTCYYGPTDPPPRHQWRVEEPRVPDRHDWRAPEQAADLPLPARRPAAPAEDTETADSNGTGTERDDEAGPADATADAPATEPPQMSARRRAAAEGDIPQRYLNAENTVGHTLTAIQRGASLYREHCTACHGAAGEGDGPRAQSSGPSMPSLPYTLEQAYSTDAYLLWTIMRGGVPFGTDKPAFAEDLTREQAWQIIAYMRAGFPARSPERPLRQTLQTQTGNTSAGTR